MNNITIKDSYIMYKNWSRGIVKLTDEQAGQLIKAICKFQDGEEVEPEDVAADALFEIFKEKMIEDAETYKAKCERLAENFKGKSQKDNSKTQKGDKKTQKAKSETQKANKKDLFDPKGSVSVSDTYTVSDTKIKDIKERYGENGNVTLTIKEREKLIADFGLETTEKAIEYLDGYIADKGYKSQSNYQAIRRWVIDAVKDKTKTTTEKFDLDAYLKKRMNQ